jgi:tRNA/tmRNA/rRNA uracil-C5-methylase (TrmA/RlmC/RlmD family)
VRTVAERVADDADGSLGAELELALGGPAAGGGFIARDEAGRVVFVRHGLTGERVRAVITESHATWARADAVEVLVASPDRVAAPCPYAGPGACGGCDYQHVALHAQPALKQLRIEEQLRAIARIDLEVPVEQVSPTPTGLGTRTRVRYATDHHGRLSMRRSRSHDLVVVETCALGVGRVDEVSHSRASWPSDADVEVVALEGAAAPSVVVGARQRDAAHGTSGRTEVLDEPGLAPRQSTTVGGQRYEVSPGVFWQVHAHGPEVLAAAVLGGLSLGAGDRVCDLYCGAGLFTKAAAAVVGPTGSVLGIDASREAIADARRNLAEQPWARVEATRVDRRSVERAAKRATQAVFDPPRRGVDRGALRALCASPVRRCVSVSCDPATFARDLRVLLDEGWRLESVRALDLFEMTEHVELVGVLAR